MDQDATWYTEVGLGPGDIVLYGNPASPTERGTAVPHFSAHFPLAGSRISAAAEHLLLTKQRIVGYTLRLKSHDPIGWPATLEHTEL